MQPAIPMAVCGSYGLSSLLFPALVTPTWSVSRSQYFTCGAISEHHMLIQQLCSSLSFAQVLSIKQYATLQVQAYPHLIQIDCMLEALARDRKEPSQQQILASAHTVDTGAHWANMRIYHAQLSNTSVHVYVPFRGSFHEGSNNSSASDETSTVAVVERDTATWFLHQGLKL